MREVPHQKLAYTASMCSYCSCWPFETLPDTRETYHSPYQSTQRACLIVNIPLFYIKHVSIEVEKDSPVLQTWSI